MVEPVGRLDQRRAFAGDRIGERGAVAGRAEADVLLERRVLAGGTAACRGARGGGDAGLAQAADGERALLLGLASRPAAVSRRTSASFAAGSCGYARPRRGRGGAAGRAADRARRARRRPRRARARILADGDPPGVEIVATRRSRSSMNSPAAERSNSSCSVVASARPRFTASRRSTTVDLQVSRVERGGLAVGDDRIAERRAACKGSSAARPWDRRALPRTGGTAGRGGPAALAAR